VRFQKGNFFMGADLYLQSVLQACHERYGQASHLVDHALRLAMGDVAPALDAESQRLKEALTRHARQAGEMPTDLFDLVAEIADLAQGACSVWAGAIAEQIAALLFQVNSETTEIANDIGPSGLVCLAHDLVEVLRERPEAAIMRGAAWLARRLETEAQGTEGASQVLAGLGTSLREVLEGNGTGALALLVERRMIPALSRASADQADCLRTLAQALDPLMPSIHIPLEGGDFAPGLTLARWLDLARRLQDLTDRLRTDLCAALEAPVFQHNAVTGALASARARFNELWPDAEALLPELETAMDTLGSLLMRTLPLPDQVPGDSTPIEVTATAPLPPVSSPLRQAFGTILRHRVICQGVALLIGRCAHAAGHLLGEERLPALREICRELAAVLSEEQRQSEPDEPEPALIPQLTERFAHTVPLAPGVTMLPGTMMDMCYIQMQATIHMWQKQSQVQEWVSHAIEEEPPTAGITGIVLRFWRLLQGEPVLWAQLLAELMREQFYQASGQPARQEQVMELLDQLQGLLEARPAPRLQALLHELDGRISSTSPLAGPVARLAQLTRGDIGEAVRDAFQQLTQEVSHLAAQADSPEEQHRVADLNWLLELGAALLLPEEEARRDSLCRMLVTLCADCQQSEPQSPDAAFAAQMAQVFLGERDEHRQRDEFLALLESLEDAGPQPPRADPRLAPLWRFRLLRILILKHLRLNERREAEANAGEPAHPAGSVPSFTLVAQVLQTISRALYAWLFPANGYFRDDYNDGSILWIAAGIFWPAIADQIAEPIDVQNRQSAPWLAEEGEIPAQIPVERVRELLTLLQESEPHLPSSEHLTRWGSHTIRVEEQGPYALSAWHAYFAQRRAALLAFLEEAIARQEPILCSL
jgi:hypothetical protein